MWAALTAGSSPLARGLPGRFEHVCVMRGIIPARAGFTGEAEAAGGERQDHPRSRGVYHPRQGTAGRGRGSSPLARGLQRPASPHARGRRIIPARAGFTRRASAGTAPWQDHPRSRGVYLHPANTQPQPSGSSPLARGLRLRQGRHGRAPGIIPARAGFTPPTISSLPREEDHPRSRGVYGVRTALWARIAGSSPLARGLHWLVMWVPHATGIIPARAGFTVLPGPVPVAVQDHPRSRGVYPAGATRRCRAWGSSPLARGLLRQGNRREADQRIIPARAGFTAGPPGPPPDRGDHPRSRGVYVVGVALTAGHRGSSPLARGLPPRIPYFGYPKRIIPARAGFTDAHPPVRALCRDHPRSRGVYQTGGDGRPRAEGSSPLARGLHHLTEDQAAGWGIIPARAGFTASRVASRSYVRDHPRSRGVYSSRATQPAAWSGSSPLARGLPICLVHRALTGRIIPARAGFTPLGGGAPSGSADHPRSRGVYHGGCGVGDRSRGSSPLARGLQGVNSCRLIARRIIPARAGFTRGRRRGRPSRADHPRSRGVYP